MKKPAVALLAAVALAGCMRLSPEIHPRPASVREPSAAHEAPRDLPPLVIEVALVPEPGSPPCGEAPAAPRDYFEEVRECAQLGAAVVRVQPLAPDSGPGGVRYDRSLRNYREIVRGVLVAAPNIVLDVDLEGAPPEVVEWARCNGRIEICAARGRRTLLTPAGGEAPLEEMRKIIRGGGHLRLGLRESRAWPHKGRPLNLDYLRQAVSMARAAGRPIASPALARKMFGLKPLAHLYAAPSARVVKAGKRFSLDAVAQPFPEAVKGYAVIIAPDGKRHSLTKRGLLSRRIVPFIVSPKGIRIAYCRTLVDALIHPATRRGDYTIVLALVRLRSAPRLATALAVATEKVTVE